MFWLSIALKNYLRRFLSLLDLDLVHIVYSSSFRLVLHERGVEVCVGGGGEGAVLGGAAVAGWLKS